MELLKWLTICDRYSRMYLDKELAALHLNSGQYFYILKICEEPGITQDRLITIVHVNPSNVTRAIAHLEKESFIEKKQNEKDRRTYHLYPTEKSIQTYPFIKEIKNEWIKLFLKDFDVEEKEELALLLEKLGKHAISVMKFEKEEVRE